jgi:hypothetical protein
VLTFNTNVACNNFTLTGGTLALQGRRLTCLTFTSTGATATTIDNIGSPCEIEVTSVLGTVINVTKSTTQLTIGSQANLTLILSAIDGGSTRTIVFSNASWGGIGVTMPRLSITNGTGLVTIQHASNNDYNLYSYNSTGFTGTFGYTLTPLSNQVYIYGSFISPTSTWSASTTVQLSSLQPALFTAIAPNVRFQKRTGFNIQYTQSGPINVSFLSDGGESFGSGYFVLNTKYLIQFWGCILEKLILAAWLMMNHYLNLRSIQSIDFLFAQMIEK